ncbi:MAG: putative lipid II flippase FtsW [Spirochaetes bacterium]|nr:putative lipid II flippase FtsW [Spirochaetota bacterium]
MKKLSYSMPDFKLLAVAYIIIALGISMVYSSSIHISRSLYHDQYYLFKNQLLWLVLGTIFLMAIFNMNYTVFLKVSRVLLLVNLLLLIVVLVPSIGKKVAGSRSWIRYKYIGFQPSEFIKISLILYLSTMFNKKKINTESFIEGYLPPLIISTLVFFLILLQPDFGSAILIASIIGLLFYISRIKIKFLVMTFFMILPFAYYLITRVSYRKMRFLTFFDPYADPIDKGYHVLQSIKCFNLGSLTGVGIGKGIQKLWYLPQPHTDFIYSVIGEEMGFLGSLGLLLLFAYLVFRAFKIAYNAPDKFSFLAASGIGIMWSIQILINIFVTLGLIPVTGLPLPFISYGGSSLITNMIGVGILLSISKAIEKEKRSEVHII